MWFVGSVKVMLPTDSSQSSSAGGAKRRSRAVQMLSTERFETKVSGRGYHVRLHTDLDITLVLGAMYAVMLLTDCCEYIVRIFRCCADNFYVVLRNFYLYRPVCIWKNLMC